MDGMTPRKGRGHAQRGDQLETTTHGEIVAGGGDVGPFKPDAVKRTDRVAACPAACDHAAVDWLTTILPIPHGNAGNRMTLRAMSILAQEGSVDPVVTQAAQNAVLGSPQRTPEADFAGVLADVRRRMRYTNDPLGAEVVKEPRYIIDRTNASSFPEPMDCDDASVLTGAMLGSLGYQTKFATVATDRSRPGEWSHVYVSVQDPRDGRWIPLDPIVPEFGVGMEVPEDALTAPRAYHEGVDPMLNGHNRLAGYGFGEYDPYSSDYSAAGEADYAASHPGYNAASNGGGSSSSGISLGPTLDSVANVLRQAVGVYAGAKKAVEGPVAPAPVQPIYRVPSAGMSTTTKVLLGVAGAAIGVAIIAKLAKRR